MKSLSDCSSITSLLFAVVGIGLFGNILVVCSARSTASSSSPPASAAVSTSDSDDRMKINSLRYDHQATFARPSTWSEEMPARNRRAANIKSVDNAVRKMLIQQQLINSEDDVDNIDSSRSSSSSIEQHVPSNIRMPIRGLSKRHCWDVSDVCCMWNVC